MQDLPLKKICPICGRYIIVLKDEIFNDGIWSLGLDYPLTVKPSFWICPVCATSLKNNEPLRQKVWADLTKKTK